MATVKKFLIKTSRSSAWRQAKKKSSSVTACRPATASIFAKLFQRATPTPAKKSPATALIALPECVTSSAGAKWLLEGLHYVARPLHNDLSATRLGMLRTIVPLPQCEPAVIDSLISAVFSHAKERNTDF